MKACHKYKHTDWYYRQDRAKSDLDFQCVPHFYSLFSPKTIDIEGIIITGFSVPWVFMGAIADARRIVWWRGCLWVLLLYLSTLSSTLIYTNALLSTSPYLSLPLSWCIYTIHIGLGLMKLYSSSCICYFSVLLHYFVICCFFKLHVTLHECCIANCMYVKMRTSGIPHENWCSVLANLDFIRRPYLSTFLK